MRKNQDGGIRLVCYDAAIPRQQPGRTDYGVKSGLVLRTCGGCLGLGDMALLLTRQKSERKSGMHGMCIL